MIFWELFLAFLQVGAFTIGGGYGVVPLIRDVVLSHGWMTEERLTYMIAVSESTPGPIMVNMATYVGTSQAGFAGAVVATTAVVLPSFVMILLIAALMKSVVKNPGVQAVMKGLKACVIGIILATGGWMTVNRFFVQETLDGRALVITLILATALFGSERITKKRISPIALIALAACIGIIAYGV